MVNGSIAFKFKTNGELNFGRGTFKIISETVNGMGKNVLVVLGRSSFRYNQRNGKCSRMILTVSGLIFMRL